MLSPVLFCTWSSRGGVYFLWYFLLGVRRWSISPVIFCTCNNGGGVYLQCYFVLAVIEVKSYIVCYFNVIHI